jgi:hypothetical protein
MKRQLLVFSALLLLGGGLSPQEGAPVSASAPNPSFVRREVEYPVRDSVDKYGTYNSPYSQLASVLTFVNDDGSITLCSSDENAKTTYVYEYSPNFDERSVFSFQNELDQLGAFTKDDEGNYYFFYGSRTANKTAENMAMVKRNQEGEIIKTFKLKAAPPRSMDGIRIPFDAGTCRLEVSGSLLAVYFAREMFSGHQASYGFVLDKDSFERIDTGAATNAGMGNNTQMPYSSHSFNQFILPVDGAFIFADHGDAYPRCFTFAKFQKGSNTKRLHAFKFPGQIGQNVTNAEMGGLAKTSTGYIFTGAYRKDANSARNLFILTFDETLSSCTLPLYLTKYSKETGQVGHPKISAIDSGRYLLLWELYGASRYLSTYMLVIDEKGAALSEVQELKGIRLNMNDIVRYNRQNGKVYWSVNETSKALTVYALDVK